MADPLSLLRTYVINKREIIERNDEIILGDFAWPKNVKTNFVMWGSERHGAPKDYYTLEALVLFLKNSEDTHAIYVRQAAAKEIPPVRRPDRKDLLAYLHGSILTCASIDQSAQLNLPNKAKRVADCNAKDVKSIKKPKLEEMDVQKVKQQLAARLQAPKEASVSINTIKSLSEAMSVEKIAAIKAKRLANKRVTIKENDNVVEKKYDMKALFDSDVDATKIIITREREWTNRTTILQAGEKKFDKSIFAMLNRLKIREEQQAKLPQPPPAVQPRRGPRSMGNPSGYSRYDQERFNPKQETEGFQINTMGSYHGMTIKTVAEGGKIEFRVADMPPNLPLSSAPQLPDKSVKRVSRTPIIIIPAAATSLITMLNAKDILQDFKFVTTEQKKSEVGRRYSEVLIQRQRGGGVTVPYLVIDNTVKLKSADWDRVVAVFVLGPAWQFKGYPWKDPVEIFSKICAFHLKYDEIKMDANVGRWAVTVINLSRTRRHLDRAALLTFWEKLDAHMKTFKPHLRF